jgi:hypothetical protein
VSLLREAHDNFLANEPLGSSIANSLFTAVWASIGFVFCSLHDATFGGGHYVISFFFNTSQPALLAGNATFDMMNETVLAEEVYGIVGELRGSLDDFAEMANAQSFWDVLVIGIRFVISIFFL